jgi:hypothetical protein
MQGVGNEGVLERNMRRFHFHLRAGDRVIIDDEGEEFLDVSTAGGEALQTARELLGDAIKAGKERRPIPTSQSR